VILDVDRDTSPGCPLPQMKDCSKHASNLRGNRLKDGRLNDLLKANSHWAGKVKWSKSDKCTLPEAV
jgi:hypothetical protein